MFRIVIYMLVMACSDEEDKRYWNQQSCKWRDRQPTNITQKRSSFIINYTKQIFIKSSFHSILYRFLFYLLKTRGDHIVMR